MKRKVVSDARRLTATFLTVAFVIAPGKAWGQAAIVMPVLINVGAWMAEKIADHYVGKALDSTDEALGEKHKESLKAARSKLEESGAPTAQDRETIQSISNQIALLNELLKQQANADPRAMQARLEADLADMHKSLSDRDKRVAELQSIVEKLQVALAQAPSGPRPSAPATPPSPPPSSAVKPSFDCNKATTFVEKEICGNARLASADAELGRIYWAARNRLPKADSDRLFHEEVAWLRQRDYLLRSVCIGPTQHLDTDCALFFWNQRIAELPKA